MTDTSHPSAQKDDAGSQHVRLPAGLAIFDLDGTLLQTSAVDDECYAQAVADLFGIRDISTDWGSYSDSTDAGILDDLLRGHFGRSMTLDDVHAHQRRFVELLEAVARRSPDRFAPTKGARDVMGLLRSAGWVCALATGGWRPSALLKLRVAGLDVASLPAAFADDHRSREGIIRCAMERAGWPAMTTGSRDGQASPTTRAVYIGDGVWDVRAARSVGIGFVGVASGERATRLRHAGALRVIDDLAELERVLAEREEQEPEKH